ncbi:GHKL domain-containing protein [Muricauda sp. HICW]|uniref:histidine kinase n=1 Tax=Flagellimonas chongwuensis TaxID=2697365 RepID=A0A850NEZ7_9FLAO|nr:MULTISPECIES: HAMP domain-containing sensor histidine kinase [Allomuricauda]NVN19423.1 GHKL domain-containing protein [Allomuricauda chongwuensis]
MHSLLKRQLNKYLPEALCNESSLEELFEAIGKSYEHYDEKLSMLQRATAISSDELYDANRELEKEAARQKKVLNSLENALTALQSNFETQEVTKNIVDENFDAEKLARQIKELAQRASEMGIEKDGLLKDLARQNESLNSYAHVVSHDLKSPIRNISALIAWIEEDERDTLSEQSQQNLSLALQNLEKMDKLITGILKHATLGNKNSSNVEFNLEELLGDIQQNIFVPNNVSFQFQENLPKLCFDKYKIEQLFMNLMTNAVKALENKKKGTVRIDFKDKGDNWYFAVADNGKGIPEEHQTDIFEMFNKLENDEMATGIGLALVKKIVGLYGGKVWVESLEGLGTTFHFTLKKQEQ